MFERFTPEARRVVVFAQDEARALGHGSIGPEHLLLAVLRVQDGAGARGLGSLGLTLERARAGMTPGTAATHGQIPFEPRLRRTLDVALSEAMSLGHDEVGTAHLAFALIAEREGACARILNDVAAPEALRTAVLDALAAPAESEEQPDGAMVVDVPRAVTVVLGDDVQALLRRAAVLALAEDAAAVHAEHVRRALDR